MNIKKFLSICACAFAFFANSLSAQTTWIYDSQAAGTTELNWSSTIGSSGVDGLWYYLSEDGVTRNYMQGSYSQTDNFIINSLTDGSATAGRKVTGIVLDGDVSIGNISISNADSYNIVSIKGKTPTTQLNIGGNFDITELAQGTVPKMTSLVLNVSGNLTSSAAYFEPNCSKIIVGGDLIGKNNAMNTFGAYSGTGSLASPDMLVSGVVKGFARFCLRNDNNKSELFYQFGGIENISSTIRIYNSDIESGKLYLTLANKGVNTLTSGISEVFAKGGNDPLLKVDPLKRSRTVLIMNGAAGGVQSFTSAEVLVSGGIKVNSGEMRMNFGQIATNYTFKATYKKTPEETAARTFQITYWTDNTKTTQTTFSHGDLTMQGGTFAATGSYGSFRFTNIVYSGGKIALRLGSTNRDSIDLTSYYQHEVNTVDSADTYWSKENGGTVKFADDALAGSKVTFDFGNDLLWLTKYGESENGFKVIAWDTDKKSALNASDFAANAFSSDGEFEAKFTVADDGLYVKYVQSVPEPAAFAALFGIFASVLALIRRRQK